MNTLNHQEALRAKLEKILGTSPNPYHLMSDCLIVYGSVPIDSFVSITKLFSKTAAIDISSQANANATIVIGEPLNIEALRKSEAFKTLCSSSWQKYMLDLTGKDIYPTLPEPIRHWFETGRIGCSARTLLNRSLGKQYGFYDKDDYTHDSPLDIYDFKRCAELVKAVPELTQHLPVMTKVSPLWAYAVERWEHFNLELDKVERGEQALSEVASAYKSDRPSSSGVKFGR
ncbi:MAG: hypothetical protein CTY38_01220 [Methylotenera sp.]|uniref:hypothetical protein n=1 Tax=Methylotenera sp. TaxID=2051956 RepID=UPI000D4436A9|nr:hypothetical protein [Methylotenera sp.]PPC84697.1 MAG: hypothetical protein CTY38_01220 [Methylotenera sp.]